MSIQTVAHKFVEWCRQGKNFDVMREMYAPNIVSVEGDGKATAGQQPVIKKSEDWGSDKTFNGETVAGPFFNGAAPRLSPQSIRRAVTGFTFATNRHHREMRSESMRIRTTAGCADKLLTKT